MNRKQTIAAIAAIISLTACVKETLNETDHPGHGKIISLTTRWEDRNKSIDIPASYTLKIGDYTATMQGTTNSVSHLFPAGKYVIYLYNEAENISVNSATATANYSSGLLGCLFTGTETIEIEADKDYTVTVDMRQQVRQLTLKLDVTGDARNRITGVDASLSGVAGAIDVGSGNPAGEALTVNPLFMQTDGGYSATIHLLGVQGNTQILSFTLHFADSNPKSYTLTSDLSDLLAEFNTDKKTPLSLQSILTVTPTQTGLASTIADWIQGGVNTGTAD